MNLDSNENSGVKLLTHRDLQPTQEADYITLDNKNGNDFDNDLDLQQSHKK